METKGIPSIQKETYARTIPSFCTHFRLSIALFHLLVSLHSTCCPAVPSFILIIPAHICPFTLKLYTMSRFHLCHPPPTSSPPSSPRFLSTPKLELEAGHPSRDGYLCSYRD